MDRSSSNKSARKSKNTSKTRIEADFSSRHTRLKRKIDSLKNHRIHELMKNNQDVPKINPKSRRLASKSEKSIVYSPSRLMRTHEILRNSRFMPKKVEISLEKLKLPLTTLSSPLRTKRYGISITSQKPDSPITFPSLVNPSDSSKILESLPKDITMRNELLFNLRNETSTRGFQLEPQEPPLFSLPFSERTSRWLSKKSKKLLELREKKEKDATKGCTFKPELKSKRVRSRNSSQRTLSSETSYSDIFRKRSFNNFTKLSFAKTERIISVDTKTGSGENTARVYKQLFSDRNTSHSYNGICPVNMTVGYSQGFSSEFKKKAKPMLDYKSLNIKS